jgi:hypothetical protein
MCPNLVCRKVLAVPESLRGKTVRCKACATNIKVPAKQVIVAPPPPDPANAKDKTKKAA